MILLANTPSMIIRRLKAKNYRSLENFEVEFNPFYNALSGKNNSGKSNVIRAILTYLVDEMDRYRIFGTGIPIKYERDYPHWKKKDKERGDIQIEVDLELDEGLDAGLFKFIKELIFKNEVAFNSPKELLKIVGNHSADHVTGRVVLTFGGHEIKGDYQKEEFLTRLRSSQSIIFHNSTENLPFFYTRGQGEHLSSYIGNDDLSEIVKRKQSLEVFVKKSLKRHQTEFGAILGRLQEKYEASLSISSLDIEKEQVEIALKEKGVEVLLEDYGSGTRNRTLILLNVMNAKRVQNSDSLNERLTPVLVIEEPESFLHPSAQAEFGRILQDLAVELKIQIIVATHSPYLLSHKSPSANILLERNNKASDNSSKILPTNNDKWYEPFALSLGISGADFGPLETAIFSGSNDIILVEGDSDKEYLELLMDERHGNNKLKFAGGIYAYGGAGNLTNNILLRFVKERFKRFVVTVDLDKFHEVKGAFATLNLRENFEYMVIGKPKLGSKCIEGLVPEKLLKQVYFDNAELVRQATENSTEAKKARQELKRKILKAFKTDAEICDANFSEFYKLSKTLNKIFK